MRSVPEEVARHIPEYRPIDTRPYEFIWARSMPRQDHWLDFERLLGWRVETSVGAVARIERCRAFQLWGEFVGLVTYSSVQPDGWIRLIPPQPLVVVDPVDTVKIWLHSSGTADVSTARFACKVEDSNGQLFRLDLGQLYESGWRLGYSRLPNELLQIANYPLRVVAFEWSQLPVIREAELRLDGLSLFMDALDPIRFEPRRRRPLALAEGQLVGINRGEGVLPFPEPVSTILPKPSSPDARISVQEEARGQFIVSDPTHGQPLSYRVDATNGLVRIDVLWEGEGTDIVLQGIQLAEGDMDAGNPLVIRQERRQVYLEYRNGMILRISAQGPSLIVDVDYRGRSASAIWAGPLSVARQFVSLEIPYLHQEKDAVPPVLFMPDSNPPLFAHMMLDPYRSNASELAIQQQGEHFFETWHVGAVYHPRTDQVRNHLHERFIVSVCTQLLDVLPVIPAARGAFATQLMDRFVSERRDPPDADRILSAMSGAHMSSSVDAHRLFLKTESIWREEQESRSFRTRTNPHLGGADFVQNWFSAMQINGAMLALNIHLRELSPLNQFWSSDHLLRTPANEWHPVDGFAFHTKPLFALEWMSEFAAGIHSRYQPGAYWLGEFSAHPPWLYSDFDRRVPGAATFSQSLFADGDLLISLSEETGVPVLGSAGAARFYAGLMDGLVTGHVRDTPRPYDPEYKLHRLQPLAVVFAPPLPDDLFDHENDPVGYKVIERLDSYLADQIAYGNAGRLPHPEEGVDPLVEEHILYSLLALQRRTLLRRPERILYGKADGYVTLATAMNEGIWHHSFLYIEYPDNLEIWVNGSDDRTWTVRVDEETYELPPSGWLAASEDVFAFSGRIDGHRIDYVESPEYLYFHPRGKALAFRQLESVDGSPQLLKVEDLVQPSSMNRAEMVR